MALLTRRAARRRHTNSVQLARDKMRLACFFALLAAAVSLVLAAPDRSILQTGRSGADSQPFVEEVVVESVLHVRNPSANRQARTNTHTNLQDGARVAVAKP
ncbi:uncharacterized protein LOC115454482 [Manduca sexta]|uniref:uncharacterized protein LOC115454482 n=1 Tax=Manduca sexta TaxID=7130 RepID=UPI0011822F37|nr:uncharacterized protein LOC115454482 [Manduca sexta]